MDNILITSIVFLFMMGYIDLLCLLFITFLITGLAPLNFKTLFFCTLFTLYYIYGIIGTIITSIFTMCFICCGIMYWHDMTYEDIKKEIQKISDEEKTKDFLIYKQKIIDLYPLMFTNHHEKIIMYKNSCFNYYKMVSIKFDIIYNEITYCSQQFRIATNDMILFKYMYMLYDKLYEGINEFFTFFESLKNLYKISRKMNDIPDQLLQNFKENKINGNILDGFNDAKMNEIIKMNEQFEKNMSPQQKKQMDDLAKQFMNDLNMSDVFNMIDNIDSSKDSIKNRTKKKFKR